MRQNSIDCSEQAAVDAPGSRRAALAHAVFSFPAKLSNFAYDPKRKLASTGRERRGLRFASVVSRNFVSTMTVY